MTAICAGRLNPEDDKDILVIGTKSTLLAYHVENNTDLFYKQVILFFACIGYNENSLCRELVKV